MSNTKKFFLESLEEIQDKKNKLLIELRKEFGDRMPVKFDRPGYDARIKAAEGKIVQLNELVDQYFSFLPKREISWATINSQILEFVVGKSQQSGVERRETIKYELKKRFLADSEEKVKGLKLKPEKLVDLFDFDEDTLESIDEFAKSLCELHGNFTWLKNCFDETAGKFQVTLALEETIREQSTTYFNTREASIFIVLSEAANIFSQLAKQGMTMYKHQDEMPRELLNVVDIKQKEYAMGIDSLSINLEKFKDQRFV